MGVIFSILRQNFMIAAMELLRTEKCHCLASEHESSVGLCSRFVCIVIVIDRKANLGDSTETC